MKGQRGNALFVVLIGIALFAALSMAVMRAGGGSDGVDKEKLKLVVGEVTGQMQVIKAAVDKVRYVNGCKDSEIAFYSYGAAPYTENSVFRPDTEAKIINKCNIYHPDGGGLTPPVVPEGVGRLDNFVSDDYLAKAYVPWRAYIGGVGRDYTTTSLTGPSEIAVTIQMLNEDVCIAINEALGVPNPGGAPPTDTNIHRNTLAFECKIRTAKDCSTIIRTDHIAELYGKSAACFYNPNFQAQLGTPRYTYYQVVFAQ